MSLLQIGEILDIDNYLSKSDNILTLCEVDYKPFREVLNMDGNRYKKMCMDYYFFLEKSIV